MDARLLEILVCPLCKGPLQRLQSGRAPDGSPLDAELLCRADRLAFPVRDGIPVMLVDEARKVGPEGPEGPSPAGTSGNGDPSGHDGASPVDPH